MYPILLWCLTTAWIAVIIWTVMVCHQCSRHCCNPCHLYKNCHCPQIYLINLKFRHNRQTRPCKNSFCIHLHWLLLTPLITRHIWQHCFNTVQLHRSWCKQCPNISRNFTTNTINLRQILIRKDEQISCQQQLTWSILHYQIFFKRTLVITQHQTKAPLIRITFHQHYHRIICLQIILMRHLHQPSYLLMISSGRRHHLTITPNTSPHHR